MLRFIVAGLIILAAGALIIGYAGMFPFGDDGERAAPNTDDGDDSDAVALGRSIYEQRCVNCHSIDDSPSLGPSFQGLYGSEVTMEDGSTVVVDEEHIVESITDPQARIREGFPSSMQPFRNLSEEELDGLVAFIRSLE